MAYLIKCPLCNRDVSSEALACPGCGHGIAGEKIKEKILGTWKWIDHPTSIEHSVTFQSNGIVETGRHVGRYSIRDDVIKVVWTSGGYCSIAMFKLEYGKLRSCYESGGTIYEYTR